MSNKLCLYETGHFTKPVMCSLWLIIKISYNYCRFSFVIASVGFNIDRGITQQTPKCVKNCSDTKVSIIVSLTFTSFSITTDISLKATVFFFKPLTNYFVMNGVCHVH